MAIWHKKADVMNGIRESFLSLDWFSLTFKTYSYGPLKGLNRPHRPHGSVTDWVSVRASRIHADNIWLSSRLLVFDFMWFTTENELSHTYDLPINAQKPSAMSFCFGYFSMKTPLSPHETVSLHIAQFHLLWRWLLLKRQHFSKWDQQESKQVVRACRYLGLH